VEKTNMLALIYELPRAIATAGCDHSYDAQAQGDVVGIDKGAVATQVLTVMVQA
jgi:hypothetical protein